MTTVLAPQPPTLTDLADAPLEDRILAHAERQAQRGLSIHIGKLPSVCGCSAKAARHAIKLLADRGAIKQMIGHGGWVLATAPHRSFMPTSLAALLDLAREHTDPTYAAPKGRKALDANREVWVLSSAQWDDIERMATLVASRLPGAHGNLYTVTGGLLMWAPEARGGQGEWALAETVRSLTREQHREKHTAKRSQTPWQPDMAEESVSKNVGAAQNLMYLAATYGLISRAPAMEAGGPYMYSPGWIPILERVIHWMNRHSGATNPSRASHGARVLATYATKLGGVDIRRTDWLAVRDRILTDGAHHVLPTHRVIAARWVWRAVVAHFGPRLGLGDEYIWALKSTAPVTLVGARAIEVAADPDTSERERDFSGWVLPDGRFAAGLVEGQYGLRRWAAWSTLEDLKLRLSNPPLAARVWKWPSSLTTRRKGAAPRRVSAETLQSRLTMFAYMAGFAAKMRRVDWADENVPGLLVLADPQFVDAFMRWMLELPQDSRGTRYNQLSQRVRTLTWLVNGFLAGEAERVGDSGRVEQLGGWYRDLESICAGLPRPKHLDRREAAAHVLAIANGWKGGDDVDGLVKLEQLVGCMEAELVGHAGGQSIADQIDAIRTGSFKPGSQWGKTLRMMIVLLIAQRLPLRAGTLVRLTTSEWRNLPVGPAQQALANTGALAAWEGQLGVDVPGRKMKSKRDFPGRLIQAEFVRTPEREGDPNREHHLRRDLFELWFMDGGGRDVCRTQVDARTGRRTLQDVPWLFPDAVGDEYGTARGRPPVRGHAAKGRKVNAAPGRWRRTRLSAAFKRVVTRHAVSLSINLAVLQQIEGALGYHTVRRLFGSYWAPRNLLVCSRLLDHTDIKLTADIYCGQDVRSMTLDLAA
jgi:hypothetical protein